MVASLALRAGCFATRRSNRTLRSLLVATTVIVLTAAGWVAGQRPAASQSVVRFAAVDVYVDATDKTLGAYQFELTAEVGEIAIVGIEGGEHPAFAEPPYYDPLR